jgi:predicted nucleotidyltransferase
MTLLPFSPQIDASIRAMIECRLAEIEATHSVRLLFAVESGSRAWGFPSPDSDYDVRFVYARPLDWYLSLAPGRDVIEYPIADDLDIGGWDIRKALTLLLKPNPVLLEWLSSPVRYRWSDALCAQLMVFANQTAYGAACLYHYRNLAKQQWQKHVGDRAQVNYKKYFYILRPALAIHWLRSAPGTPPMNLQALVAGLSLSPELVAEIDTLLVLKSQAKEIGAGPRAPIIDAFIRDQIEWAAQTPKADPKPDLLAEGDALFRSIVKGELAEDPA